MGVEVALAAADPRLVVDVDVDADAVADVITGAIGPLISNSSRTPRFVDVGVTDVVDVCTGTGLGRCFDDDDDDDDAAGAATAVGVADTRAALADCGVGVGAGADFLDGVGRVLD
jgi:hypothetical protein